MSKFHFLRNRKDEISFGTSSKRFSINKDRKIFEIYPEEVFLDRLAKKKEEEFGISEKKFEVPLSKKILYGFLISIFLVFLVFFGKLFQFQILEYEKYALAAEQNKFISRSTQAARGVVYDGKGEQLAFNKYSFDLVVNKDKLPESDFDKEQTFKKISEIIGKDSEFIKEKIEQEESGSILISENLEHAKLIALETKIGDLPGIEIKQNLAREYIDGKMFSNIIGYTGKVSPEELRNNAGSYSAYDYSGKDGVEKIYEDVLRRNSGEIRIERDASGNVISQQIISAPKSGDSLVLWLDAELQKKIIKELEKILEKTGSKKAMAVALDPNSGGVLALANIPGFDNNLFSKGTDSKALSGLLSDPQEPLFNRAIKGLYPSGSTIKPLISIAALEEKIISPNKEIYCGGGIAVPNRYNPKIVYIYKDNNTHGWTSIRKAIAESCNVFFFTIGGGYGDQKGLGPSLIKKYLELFGWGNKTGIDLPGESAGLIPSPDWKKQVKKESWWDGDTYNLSIGQGNFSITPLQVATAFVAIANKGTLYKPLVVKEIIDSEKKVVKEIESKIIRKNFFSQKNIEIVREGMRDAVTGEGAQHASSVILRDLPIEVAAKTGTAETSLPNHYHNWVTVFAPYDNPQIVLTVMIENVPGVQAAALPVAKEVLNWYFASPSIDK